MKNVIRNWFSTILGLLLSITMIYLMVATLTFDMWYFLGLLSGVILVLTPADEIVSKTWSLIRHAIKHKGYGEE